MKNIFYKTIKLILKFILGIIGFVLLYLVCAMILSYFPYNSDFKTVPDGIEIYIQSNGIHTDLVLPAKNEYKDWTKGILIENTFSKDSAITYMAFGWGDKGFYLGTPQWADLKFSTVFDALFGLGGSAMHTTNYKYLQESETCKKIRVNKEQYKKLVEYIESSFLKNISGTNFCIKGQGYGKNDSFYEAIGNYHLFQTCNTWANEGLKYSGLKACLWTPFDKGIFYQYKDLF